MVVLIQYSLSTSPVFFITVGATEKSILIIKRNSEEMEKCTIIPHDLFFDR